MSQNELQRVSQENGHFFNAEILTPGLTRILACRRQEIRSSYLRKSTIPDDEFLDEGFRFQQGSKAEKAAEFKGGKGLSLFAENPG